MVYKIILNSVLLTLIIYFSITFIRSIFKYVKFMNMTHKIYKESTDISLQNDLPICHINGTLCKQIKILDFDEFVIFMQNQVNTYGIIHLLTASDDIFFNTLENHFISKDCIIIRGIGIIPKTYIDFVRIVFYLTSCNTIVYHDDKNYLDDSKEELYRMYSDIILELSNMNEFKDITDIIAIKYSQEFKDKKIIWKNNITNVLYMHGYENEPISILAAIMLHYTSNRFNKKLISESINEIVNRINRDTKKTFVMFTEDDVPNAIEDVINATTEAKGINMDDIKSVENSCLHNMFACSIWNAHKYNNKILNSLWNEIN